VSLDEVRAAVLDYERALMADDVAALDNWFLPSPTTLRADASAVLVGSEAIRDFRAGRGGAPRRVIDRLHLSALAPGVVAAVAETRRHDGARGLQSQTWVRTPAGWRVAAAHVSVEPAGAGPVWRLRGKPLLEPAGDGPLTGMGVAVKDLFAVRGFRIGAGNPTYLAEAAVQTRSADAVEALLRAGAHVAGIVQTDEFAYSLSGTNIHYGTPPNPAAPGAIPGGSSSGPASAVTLGHAQIGLGTDTAGSIRVPASYQGLWSFRPTHRAVSPRGVLPLAPDFDTVGWLTRDADTLRAVGETLLPIGRESVLDTALIPHDLFALADPGTAADCRTAAASWAFRNDLEVREVDTLLDDAIDDWVDTLRTLQGAQAWQHHGAWVNAHPGAVGSEISERFTFAATVTDAQRRQAQATMQRLTTNLRKRIATNAVVFLPASSSPAPSANRSPAQQAATRTENLRLTCLSSLAGLPALVLPTRTTGPPVGLSVLAGAGLDRSLLAMCRG
jgi:Asp-tRNA(Asn)/Glu-tRNA(Gln) amidotransferase A subunit family amidase